MMNYADLGRVYGECILYWMIENTVEMQAINIMAMQDGSGLTDIQFEIGMNWLIKNELVERPLAVLQ
ncbi:MAG: hypothetical protein EA396_04995 [Anaerolineaceae bacterium]|nr:MAG: hypothetical protein EA396_04995 [Anaerolineaceae bacterium]